MLGGVIVIAVLWFVFAAVINSKQNIFESMLSNSLSTNGVTKKVSQENQGSSLEQLSQVQFGSQNVAEVRATIVQGEEENQTKVVTTTIASPRENYVKYDEIKTPPTQTSPDLSEVMNVWGVQLADEGGSSVFSESVFGVVLFGNLPSNLKNELVDFMDQKLVYVPNYDSVGSESVNGKSAFVYDVTINTKSYAELVKKYDEMLGLELFGELNPDDYESSPSIKVKLYVGKQSRQLLKIEYEEGRAEEFTAYGIKKEIDIPENPLSRMELESKLQGVFQ